MTYQTFVFEDYRFDASTKTLSLQYSFDGERNFTETYQFGFDFAAYDPAVLDRALQMLFFMAGVSYYKAFAPSQIVIKKGEVDAQLAQFLSKTWQRGLGEFWYINQLNPRTPITFPVTAPTPRTPLRHTHDNGLLVGIGGGKDALTTVELLRDEVPTMSVWSMGHRQQLSPLAERINLPYYWVSRTFDAQLIELKDDPTAYNGHIPISAILACAGVVTAILSGKRDTVVSNEQSANEPTLSYQGVEINHQYSKSQEFERDFQAQLRSSFGNSVRYYSALRPLSELRIAELFALHGFEKYNGAFSSCNHAFTHGNDRIFWDGTCPKCAFVFLIFTPFIPRPKLEALFGGKNLLLDPLLKSTYDQLLGIQGDKPLECIGEIQESRAAMREALAVYPELQSQYAFDLPENYNFRTVQSHGIPADIAELLLPKLQ